MHTRSLRARAFTAGAVLFSLAGVMPLSASAAPVTATGPGYDVSWPQCPTGYGLPMPPSSAPAVVIGLTGGRPFTANPCLAAQVTWARGAGVPAQAYTMAGYPSAAQLAAYGSSGPWSGPTLQARLRNVGYAEATFARRQLAALPFTPGMIWIDVEALGAQPWPTGSAARQSANRSVVEGIMRGLGVAGVRYGIYANTDAWRTITGPWWLPGVPAWGTVGTSGAATAAARCRAPSLSAGPLMMVQWTDQVRDYDVLCPPFATRPAQLPPPSAGTDFSADWRADLIARTRNGRLYLYPGAGNLNGTKTLHPRRLIATNWAGYDTITATPDLTGDGIPDVLARTRNGRLYLYPGAGNLNGTKTLHPRRLIATNWAGYDTITATPDLTGDGIPDVLARTRNGRLYLYPGAGNLNGTKTLHPRRLIATNWAGYDTITATPDLTGDGIPDVLARTRNGRLYLYPGAGNLNGTKTLHPRRLIATNWAGYDTITATPDLTGDGIPDVLARTRNGRLYLYPGAGNLNGTKTLHPRRLIATNWAGYDAVA